MRSGPYWWLTSQAIIVSSLERPGALMFTWIEQVSQPNHGPAIDREPNQRNAASEKVRLAKSVPLKRRSFPLWTQSMLPLIEIGTRV